VHGSNSGHIVVHKTMFAQSEVLELCARITDNLVNPRTADIVTQRMRKVLKQRELLHCLCKSFVCHIIATNEAKALQIGGPARITPAGC